MNAWAAHAKVCNMHLERLLALVKRASPGKLPYAERVCAAGLLTQWISPHLSEGGSDPRITTRADLVADGVPLECSRKVSKRGGLHPSMVYANRELPK